MLTPPNSNHTAPAYSIAKLVKKASELPEDDTEPPSVWLTVDPATAAGTSENTETTSQGSLLIMESESERLLASGVVPPPGWTITEPSGEYGSFAASSN